MRPKGDYESHPSPLHGNIRNIALNAAFLAAHAQEKVSMKHLLEASHSEYAKLERTLTDAEVRGWL